MEQLSADAACYLHARDSYIACTYILATIMDNIIIESCYLPTRRVLGSGVYTSIIGSGVCGSIISHDVRTQYHIHTIHVSCKLFSLCSWGHGISMRTHMCAFTHGQPVIADAYKNKNY